MTIPEVTEAGIAAPTPFMKVSEEVRTSTPKKLKTSSPNLSKVFSSREFDMRTRVFTYLATKPTMKMVIEAINVVGADEKGASVQAIIKWIIANYAVSDVEKMKMQVKRAILRSLDIGAIKRSAASKGSLGASGSFVLNKKPHPKRVKIAKI